MKKPGAKLIQNRRAKFDYDIKDTYLAGLVLSGAEVRSVRAGHAHLKGAYVTAKDGEFWLINATVTPTSVNRAHLPESDWTRSRKLLLKAREIEELNAARQQGKSIIPTKLFNRGRYIKIEIATGVGKKRYDKRAVIKKRDAEREARRSLS